MCVYFFNSIFDYVQSFKTFKRSYNSPEEVLKLCCPSYIEEIASEFIREYQRFQNFHRPSPEKLYSPPPPKKGVLNSPYLLILTHHCLLHQC